MGFWQRNRTGGLRSDYAWGVACEAPPSADNRRTLLSDWRPSPEVAASWHGPEPDGRWTTGAAAFPLASGTDWSRLRLVCVNHHPIRQPVDFLCGEERVTMTFEPQQGDEVIVPRSRDDDPLNIICAPIRPASYGFTDERELGIFVKSVEYVE
jgi:hypothetical protein